MGETLRESTAQRIRALRKAAGFKSADAIANQIGIAPTRYREYEQGRVSLPYDIAWKLADAFHCTMDELGDRHFSNSDKCESEHYPQLTRDEREIIMLFRMLPEVGKHAVLAGLRDYALAQPAIAKDEQ